MNESPESKPQTVWQGLTRIEWTFTAMFAASALFGLVHGIVTDSPASVFLGWLLVAKIISNVFLHKTNRALSDAVKAWQDESKRYLDIIMRAAHAHVDQDDVMHRWYAHMVKFELNDSGWVKGFVNYQQEYTRARNDVLATLMEANKETPAADEAIKALDTAGEEPDGRNDADLQASD